VYQYTLALEIERFDIIRQSNEMLQNEYNESSKDLENLESEQQELISTLTALDEDFEALLSSLSFSAESLVGPSESVPKD
jgi:FtsZ-binding cell division protein ZapB